MPNPPWRRDDSAATDTDPRPDGASAPKADGERAKAPGAREVTSEDVRVAGPAKPAEPAGPASPVPVPAPAPEAGAHRHARPAPEQSDRLLGPDTAARIRERWHDIQASFVDDPRESVRRADELAAETLDALGEVLRERKRALDSGRGDAADTERLRQDLRRYRDLVDHMLSL
ncbi:hypothetical protein [Thermomonospora cellulosilytica]|uniref:Uncharacterized protein n=1 Tax=Thermomonospora cellulosilytica TaxID=1411118 RepID=A0A7W3RAN2_9ACTN|nr:hypothetical protein [Thermomonospora cellulosilytica]MBA9005475.1 hypothetical protein [Thermomonospora cellulosilytica]